MPQQLEQFSLCVNKDKTERFSIKHKGDESWKDIILLGSKLDTEKDIARRKGLASAAFKKYQKILTHKKTTINPKSEILRSIRNEHISIPMRNLDTRRKKKPQNRRVPTPLPQKNCRHILPKNNHK